VDLGCAVDRSVNDRRVTKAIGYELVDRRSVPYTGGITTSREVVVLTQPFVQLIVRRVFLFPEDCNRSNLIGLQETIFFFSIFNGF
jgi:hypothetical protein